MDCPIYIYKLLTSKFRQECMASVEQTYCPRMVHKPDSRRHPNPTSKLARPRRVSISIVRLQNKKQRFPQRKKDVPL